MIDSLYNWEDTSPDSDLVDHLAGALEIPEAIARTLVNRGLTSVDAAKQFMEPDAGSLHDPGLFRDMEKAVDRILSALRNHERILVLGDYDVDGITGTALLVSFLESQGGHVKYYIPDRLTEGYGLSTDVIQKAHKAKYDLMITVDSGISSVKEAQLASEFGIDLIITDHHEPHDEMPDALAVVNPKLADTRYPFRGLAGVGVAFKLVLAITDRLELDTEEILDHYIELVALGTIADLVPMLDENRFIVRRGLSKMSRSRNPGLYSLLRVSHIREEDRMDTSHVGFRLAPRINAAGRLWTPRAGVELFLATSPDRAMTLARKLDEYNRLRVQEEARIFKSAMKQLEESRDLAEEKVIVLFDENWHVGVIGIVASRIMERYHRPVLLTTLSGRPVDIENPHPEKGRILQGSARSFKDFDMYASLTECSDILITYGGHQLAAGIKIFEQDLPVLRKRLGELTTGDVGSSGFKRSLSIDSDLPLTAINRKLLRKCRGLEPCGIGNSKTVFRARGVTVVQSRPVGVDGSVLKLKIGQGDALCNAVGFGFCNYYDTENISGQLIDVVFDIQEDNYGGRSGVSMKLRDMCTSGDS